MYIALCKAGEVSHLKWKYDFQCTPRLTSSRSLTDDLEEKSEQMEHCLQQWKDELHAKRMLYSELNHFTTRQLLVLRRQLAEVQGRGPKAVDSIPLKVYNLLESVLPGVEPVILKSVLISQSSHVEMFQTLVSKLESIGYPAKAEQIAIAALNSCKEASEEDLIVWCVKNAGNKDVIDASYSEALHDPRYLALINKDLAAPVEEGR